MKYFLMVSITDAQREILLSIQGTHIWSGAVSWTLSSLAVHRMLTRQTGPSILQHPSYHLGRIGEAHVQLGQQISMGPAGARAGLCGTVALLLLAQAVP